MAKLIHITALLDDANVEQLLQAAQAPHRLLFSQDGVYNLQKYKRLKTLELYALALDIKARNITTSEQTQLIDYPQFVEMSLQFDAVMNW